MTSKFLTPQIAGKTLEERRQAKALEPPKLSAATRSAFLRLAGQDPKEAQSLVTKPVQQNYVPRQRPSKYNKVKLKVGMLFGELRLVKKAPPLKGAKPALKERWNVECSCGTQLTVPKYYLQRKPNPKTHCGCKTATLKSTYNREYRIWLTMHQRVENPNHVAYEHYRRRGITIAPEWHKSQEDGFSNFFNHIGPAPSKYHTLDRIENAKGYVPNNIRWATAEEQRANQGDLIGGFTREQIEQMGLTIEEFKRKLIDGDLGDSDAN